MSEKMPQPAGRIENAEAGLLPAERNAIEELEYPIQRILQQIEPELREGAYTVLIGDDVSGRIPAIVMNEAVRKIYKAYGHPVPMLRFVAGGHRLLEENVVGERDRELDMRSRVASLNKELMDVGKSPRALLVTEAIMTGNGMESVVRALEQEHLRTDIAAIAFIGGQLNADFKDVQRRFKSTRIVVGSEQQPAVYGKGMRYMHGVSKKNGSATATRFRDDLKHKGEQAFTQAKVNAARVLATKVGSDVADVYLAGKLEQAT